MYFLEI